MEVGQGPNVGCSAKGKKKWSSEAIDRSSARAAVTKTLAREVEKSPLLEAVARERLVKTQQAGKA
jgi:hypothetical protein